LYDVLSTVDHVCRVRRRDEESGREGEMDKDGLDAHLSLFLSLPPSHGPSQQPARLTRRTDTSRLMLPSQKWKIPAALEG